MSSPLILPSLLLWDLPLVVSRVDELEPSGPIASLPAREVAMRESGKREKENNTTKVSRERPATCPSALLATMI